MTITRPTKDGNTIRLTPYEAKCERVALALMKAHDVKYNGKNLMEDTAEDSQVAHFWRLAEIAIAAAEAK